MFTGLVEEVSEIHSLRRSEDGYVLTVSAPKICDGLREGESVAVNGVCLTVRRLRGRQVSFNVLQETMDRTNLQRARPGKKVNLERAVRAGNPMGGHVVQGHVDCVARLIKYAPVRSDHQLVVELPKEFSHYIVYKGSICVEGVSLTVSEIGPDYFTCWIVRHTHENTNLHSLRIGTIVNLEFDILAKYVERILYIRGEEQPVKPKTQRVEPRPEPEPEEVTGTILAETVEWTEADDERGK